MVNTLDSVNVEPRPVTPLGILTDHLKAAAQLLENEAVSAELKHHIQQAFKLAAGLDPYVEACTSKESPDLSAIAERTSQEAWNDRFSTGETVRALEQEMLSGHVEGQALKMIVHMTRAKTILDIGMFTGYSALAMAEALPEDGCLVACEVDPYVAELAQSLFQKTAHDRKIGVRIGAALETLNQLANDRASFDLVFIDADKKEYVQYFQTLLNRNLLAPHGFICVDNTLLQGQPYLPKEEQSENGAAIAHFNQVVADDPRVEQVLLPVRDGLTIIRRL